MEELLTVDGINFHNIAWSKRGVQLLKLKQITLKCAINEMAKAAGHEVDLLEQYHCQLHDRELT